MWNIQLFGGLEARSSDRIVSRFRYHKAGSLLGYLAYHNSGRTPPHSRETLIEMLWPEVTPEAGHKNLRNVLSALRPYWSRREFHPALYWLQTDSAYD